MCCVDIHLIIVYTCKLDMDVYRVNYWVFISCPTFVLIQHYLICVKLQLREYLQVKKLKERVSGFPHMLCLSFIEKCVRNLMPEIDAVSV
jgi:hypothetical protein